MGSYTNSCVWERMHMADTDCLIAKSIEATIIVEMKILQDIYSTKSVRCIYSIKISSLLEQYKVDSVGTFPVLPKNNIDPWRGIFGAREVQSKPFSTVRTPFFHMDGEWLLQLGWRTLVHLLASPFCGDFLATVCLT